MQTMQIPRCSDAEIEEDLNSSLELLHTDYVDLYFLHRDDPRRPAGEIVEFLEKQVLGKSAIMAAPTGSFPG